LSVVAALATIKDPTDGDNQKIFKMWFIDNIVPMVGGKAANLLRDILRPETKEVQAFLQNALKFQINLELGVLNEADARAALESRRANAGDVFPGAKPQPQKEWVSEETAKALDP
jgi:hypothetical protein